MPYFGEGLGAQVIINLAGSTHLWYQLAKLSTERSLEIVSTIDDIEPLVSQCPQPVFVHFCTRIALRTLPHLGVILRFQEDNEFKDKLLMPVFIS